MPNAHCAMFPRFIGRRRDRFTFPSRIPRRVGLISSSRGSDPAPRSRLLPRSLSVYKRNARWRSARSSWGAGGGESNLLPERIGLRVPAIVKVYRYERPSRDLGYRVSLAGDKPAMSDMRLQLVIRSTSHARRFRRLSKSRSI